MKKKYIKMVFMAVLAVLMGMALLLLLLWVIFGGVEDLRRSIYCGPSESISKPMAEAIVRAINKRGTPNKIVKLDSLNNLPYEPVECEKELLKKDRGNPTRLISYQNCAFYADKQKYIVRLEYAKPRRLYIYIRKFDLGNLDFTEVEYEAFQFKNQNISIKKWKLFNDRVNRYSKKTKGLCRYKSPIRF